MATINGRACVANGRNLLLDTDFNNLDLWYAKQYWTKQSDKYNGLTVMQTASSWSGLSQYFKVKTGDVYTFSVYARYTSGTGSSMIYWLLNNDSESGHANAHASISNKSVNLSDSWQRISTTTTITAGGYMRPRVERGGNNSNTLQIAGMKLETGTLATPLTPMPVDKVFSNGKQVYWRNYFSVSGFATNKYSGQYDIDYYDIQLLPETKYTISTNHIRYDGAYDMFVGNKGFTANSGVNGISATKPRTVTTDGTGILTIAARNYSIADGKDKIKVELGSVVTPWTPAPEDYI